MISEVRRQQVEDALDAELAAVRRGPLLVSGELATVGVDGEEWFLERTDGAWRIDATNAAFGDPVSA